MAKKILALGEVLWDIFPDGPRFGGAPANFACACAELGNQHVQVWLASAVGQDHLGEQALERLASHGVDTSLLQRVPQQTGQVLVTLDAHGHPSYRIQESSAWDHVTFTPELEATARNADVVHFSTLGQRESESRDTILAAVKATHPECLRILDLNLRPPFWNEAVVRECLKLATVLKLNDDELATLAKLFKIQASEHKLLLHFQNTFDLPVIALTRGAKGSLLLIEGMFHEMAGQSVNVIDTVGAGDSFTAALAIGLAHNWPQEHINRWANDVAAFVCTQPGGTPKFPDRLHFQS